MGAGAMAAFPIRQAMPPQRGLSAAPGATERHSPPRPLAQTQTLGKVVFQGAVHPFSQAQGTAFGLHPAPAY